MNILFVCEYNACRSQMAEGLARALLPKNFSICSAGLHPGELNEITVEVMKEIGIDLSGQYSKRLAAVKETIFDLVVVLAEPAWEPVNALQAKRKELWPFHDPVAIPGDLEQLKEKIRLVRDGIKERIQRMVTGK